MFKAPSDATLLAQGSALPNQLIVLYNAIAILIPDKTIKTPSPVKLSTPALEASLRKKESDEDRGTGRMECIPL
jgi:hypothetical protein